MLCWEKKKIVGYECNAQHARHLKKLRPDVNVRLLCVNGTNIIADMMDVGVPINFPILKLDIDSVDGLILDSVLSHYVPAIVYAEIVWDFVPPIDFAVVKGYSPGTGCFGVSMNMVYRILSRHGYRLIMAGHANVMAVRIEIHDEIVPNRPSDPWFWYQVTKNANYHSHFRPPRGAGSPIQVYGVKGLYSELQKTDGTDGLEKPLVQIWDVDKVMRNIANIVNRACDGHTYILALGDRCCASNWGNLTGCVCSF